METQLCVRNWLWTANFDPWKLEKPCIVYFRKEFEINEIQTAPDLLISANCRYKLYINGNFVQEGPQKGDPETSYKDRAKIGTYLKEGSNAVAVEVLYYPQNPLCRNDSLYYSPWPCLYAEGVLADHTGWKCIVADEIQLKREPFIPAPICGMERVLGAVRFQNWKKTGYDDSWWEDAKPYGGYDTYKPVSPFHLAERTIPLMAHENRTFQEVVCVRESSAMTAESLAEQWNHMLHGEAYVEIPANTTQIVEITAGEEMCGYPVLQIALGKDAEIEILYSESYGISGPAKETPFGLVFSAPQKGDRTDWQNGTLQGTADYYRPAGYGTKEMPEEYVPFLFRTFRFIRIRITTKDQGMSVVSYRYVSTGYPLEVKTHLETSDEMMNRIWDISVRTLKRCMHETYVDCPFYEQLQYTMDSRAEILFTYMLAADDRLARQCMDAFRRTQRSDGILQASAPAVSVNVIPGFSIFYILMVHDHMMYFGDQELVREHFGCIDRILEFFDRHLSEKGLVGRVGGILFEHPYWSFIDWCEEWQETVGMPTAGTMGDGSLTMESLLYLYGLEKAAELADYIGREGTAAEYRRRAARLREAILRYCVDEEGRLQDGPGIRLYSTHCQVWGILNDMQTIEQGRENLRNTFDVKGIPQCSVSMSFYLLESMKKAGCMELAKKLWEPWRVMVRNNMTTCVENFTDQRSDCHAWGALMLYALPGIYLGIRPTKPGFAEYEQQPAYGHLEWINGEIVTPAGFITI